MSSAFQRILVLTLNLNPSKRSLNLLQFIPFKNITFFLPLLHEVSSFRATRI